jgi:DNA helicase-2/ATP-dependent DNA helicase PcrA
MTLSPEQTKILDAVERLRVVRAAPGSGKTRVFVEELGRRIAGWGNRAGGIAALSFTNVAQGEIARRLGGHPTHPHFVGTLDSFLWRFVVRPFGHLAGGRSLGLRLVPAPLQETLRNPTVQAGQAGQAQCSIFAIGFCGGSEESPKLVIDEPARPKVEVPQSFVKSVLEAKKKQWSGRGLITHSDSQYLASTILNGSHGAHVAGLVAQRFPYILVDELQDTGRFLARALLAVLRFAKVSALVVGDPDQCIYGFGGADRSLFNDLELIAGRKAYPLRTSYRCSQRVANVAAALSRSGDPVSPRSDAPVGAAVLLVHDSEDVTLSDSSRSAIPRVFDEKDVVVLTRKTGWATRLRGGGDDDACPLTRSAGRRLAAAVRHLRQGEPAVAARIVERELFALAVADDAPSRGAVRTKGIPDASWRRAVNELVLEVAREAHGETWGEWLARMKTGFASQAHKLGISVDKRQLGARFRVSGGATEVRSGGRVAAADSLPVQTIHKVKGREFNAVVLFCPKPGGRHQGKCPTTEWWSDAADSEEREAAFVAASRARDTFVLCVHRQTYEAMRMTRPEFVALFDVVDAAAPVTSAPVPP